jgi:hypothetical protein
MGIDIRATVTCSLGTLISANVSDDYIQGSGLIKTKGSCEISGLISPAVGQIVTFNYTKSGVTRNVPRKLRVLSSFADPFRRTTKVELGCKLTYLSDLKDQIRWSALNDPENADFNQNDTNIVTVPIYARSIMGECLSALGLFASSIPLTNRFSIAEFDFSPGYVQVLSDLLVSESYVGYLDFNERLQVFSLLGTGSSGPIIDQSNLIDIGPIGVGDLPADAVVVSYSSLQLKAPDDEELVCRPADDNEEQPFERQWGADISTTSTESCALFAYQRLDDPDLRTSKFCWSESTEETTEYEVFYVFKDGTIKKDPLMGRFDPNAILIRDQYPLDNPVVERRNLVSKRTTKLKTGSAGVAGAIITARLSIGQFWGNYDVFKETVETFTYDEFGNEIRREAITTGDIVFKYGVASLPTTFTNEDGSTSAINIPFGKGVLEKIVVESTTTNGFTKRVTSRYGVWGETIAGQQAIAESAQYFTSIQEVESYLFEALTGLYLLDVTIETSVTGDRGAQEAPLPEDIINAQVTEDSGDPDNGYRTESTSSLELATGSPLATRRIELSLPYAPDDTFDRRTVSTIGEPLRYCYYSLKSDAQIKAKIYGLTQNRLLFGNRNGMNIQVSPEVLPNAPFGAFYLSANGAVTQYRINGTSWTMDSNGIVSSTDALYWGVAGKTA